MIEEELLLQKAKELKVEVPDTDLNSTVDRQIRDVKAQLPDRDASSEPSWRRQASARRRSIGGCSSSRCGATRR